MYKASPGALSQTTKLVETNWQSNRADMQTRYKFRQTSTFVAW